MYLDHFSLKEKAFSISPDPRFLFMSNRYREALTHLTYGVQDGGSFVLLTGEVGTGKTTVCRCLLQQLPENTRLAFVLNPKLNSVELLATICDELKVEYPENCQSLKILTDKLTEYLLECYQQGLTVVVMIDEAQNLATEVLEQVRLLTNLETNQKKLLQVILVGQPELQEKLAQRELRQLAQRITARYHLRPLNLKETMAYVLHRTRIAGARKSLFSRLAIEYLHQKSQGIPRLVNTICDRALLAAATHNQKRVDKKLMRLAASEVLGDAFVQQTKNNKKQASLPLWTKQLAGFVGLIIVVLAAYWFGKQGNETNHLNQSNELPQAAVKQEPSAQLKADINQTASTSLVEQIISDQMWDSSGRLSFKTLLDFWQVDYSPITHGDACEFAKGYGLICYQAKGNWQQLRDYNRPAIIKFSAGLQGEFWGVLKSLSGTKATLQVGNNISEISLGSLSTIWTGDYQLLWLSPEGFADNIKQGDTGEVVTWLSESLNRAQGSELPVKSHFDADLLQQLKGYQQKKGINADGIAGMQTILQLNSELMSGIPLLTL